MPGILVEPDDVCLYVTEACNSNCVMCPMSADARRRGDRMPLTDWQALTRLIPADTAHITVTGGEPFLEHARLIPALAQINAAYPHAEILVLTNGRALTVPSLFERLRPLLTDRYCFAIPIHAPDAALHDRITAAPGSFDQAMAGLRRLSATPVRTEVRIVGHALNLSVLSDTFRMLADAGMRIDVINLIAMEMTGCAAAHRQALWRDYREVCQSAEAGIRYALGRGVDIGLYNFPLCRVPRRLWQMVKDSITRIKVRYEPACAACAARDACGGMFYSVQELGLCPAEPIERDR